MANTNRIVLVAGVSCSGKTTLARRLATELDAPYLSIDDYYRPFSNLPLEVRKRVDFDSPDAIEHELLMVDLALLREGKTVLKPVYDAPTYSRLATPEPIYPNRFIIVEGLFALHWRGLASDHDFRVFVDACPNVCLQRRLERDVHKYGRTVDEVMDRYENQVEPSQRRFVWPTRQLADVVVSGENGAELALRACLDALNYSPTAPTASSMFE